MTRIAIQAVGSDDVCSVCGDDPATDYRLMSPLPAPGDVATLKLCDDCLSIRQGQQGERFAPL